MYVVCKQGVYPNATIAVCTSLERAKEVALAAARAEGDDYHSFVVLWVPVNRPIAAVFLEPKHRHDPSYEETLIGEVERQDRDRNTRPAGIHWIPAPTVADCTLGPLEQLAYDILGGDPVAIDAAQDVLCGRASGQAMAVIESPAAVAQIVREAVLAEREECAKLCEEFTDIYHAECFSTAIRGRTEKGL